MELPQSPDSQHEFSGWLSIWRVRYTFHMNILFSPALISAANHEEFDGGTGESRGAFEGLIVLYIRTPMILP